MWFAGGRNLHPALYSSDREVPTAVLEYGSIGPRDAEAERTEIMGTQRLLRKDANVSGSFSSVPGAFAAAPDGLRNAVKMEFSVQAEHSTTDPDGHAFRSPDLNLETKFSTDWLLLDLGAVDPSDIDPEAVVRDCELMARAIRDHPQDVAALIESFKPDAPLSDISRAIEITNKLGLTEEATTAAGGGLIFLAVVAGAALLSGCAAHCGQKVRGQKTTPSK